MSNAKQTGNAGRMRKAIADRQQAQAQTEIAAETKPVAAPPAEAKKPPREKGPQVKHACGHSVGVANYSSQECPACRNKARAAHNKAQLMLPMEKAGGKDDQRLPDDSQFKSYYKDAEKRWYGSLTIWVDGEARIFNDDSGAVMKLLGKLDLQYRAWLAKNTGKESADEVAPT